MSIRFLKTSNYPYLYSASKNTLWLGFTYVPLKWAAYQNGQQEGAHMQSITCTVPVTAQGISVTRKPCCFLFEFIC